MNGACSTHRRDIYIKFWSENLKGRRHSEDVEADGKITLELTSGT